MDNKDYRGTSKAETTGAELQDEFVVKYSNKGYSPKPSPEMKLSMAKSNCKGDYGCCGRLP